LIEIPDMEAQAESPSKLTERAVDFSYWSQARAGKIRMKERKKAGCRVDGRVESEV
jgi:hypothetical protein